MGDSTTVLQELKDLVACFVRERQWEQFHSPKNLAMSIAIEAAELMEIFQWAEGKTIDVKQIAKIEEELADVIIYCLNMANVTGIDISQAVQQKVQKNILKYPADIYLGKYTP